MEDPLANDPRVLRAIRYIELNPRDQATVAVRLFRRLGILDTIQKGGRHPNVGEMMKLADEDFQDILR